MAAITASVVFALIDNPWIWSDSAPWLKLAVLLGIYSLISLTLLRMGIIPGMMAFFAVNALGKIPLDTHLSSWYAPYGLATMAMLISLVTFAFWRSIGTRQLVDEEAE